jgi:hypothetical protein
MKTTSLALFASVILATAGGAFARQAPAPSPAPAPASNVTGPQLVFDNERASFGKVLDTEQVTVKFKFRNAGGSDLRLGQVKTNIDSVIFIDSTKRSFAPGETGELVFQVDPSPWRGRVGTVVTVNSNSPGEPILLTIEGIVEKTVEVRPAVARFGWLKPGQKQSLTLTIIGRTPDFRVTSARTESTSNALKVQIGEPVDFESNGEKFRRVTLDVAPEKPMPDGEVTDILEVGTSDARKSLLTIPVTGWVGATPPPQNLVQPTFTKDGKQVDAKPITQNDLPMRDGGQPAPPPKAVPGPSPK